MDKIFAMNLLMVSIEAFSGLRWSQLSPLVASVLNRILKGVRFFSVNEKTIIETELLKCYN